jgi:phosphatidylserine/phosphatidylglycerophosphate/cardiolipin synthase-like enzyme
MSGTPSSPFAIPVMGDDVAMEVLQWIGAFRALREALIISFNMQDYDFWGHGRLSMLLRRQIAYGAKVILLTTPPPGKGTGKAFKEKLALLENLAREGVEIHLHERLHAKAYIFLDDRELCMTIVGSANLTSRGFGVRGMPQEDWLELAILTADPDVHRASVELAKKRLVGDSESLDFAAWATKNHEKIAQARGETQWRIH